MANKTLKEWEKSGLDWNEYFKPGDQIDEETFLYIGEEVGSNYSDQNFMQCAEAEDSKNGIDTYSTAFATNDGKYYYLGILPDFNICK